MENLGNIDNLNNKKTSRVQQVKQSFLSRFKEVLDRKPEILKAF
jgi:hypothetical protein